MAMIIFINKKLSLDQIEPSAAKILRKCKNEILFHDAYQARHPLASYNVSLAKIAKRTNLLLDVLDKIHSEPQLDDFQSEHYPELLESTDHLLDAFMEHIDDCYGIHRSFFADSKSKAFAKSHAKLKREIEPYRTHIGSIVNFIKHNQGRLNFIAFAWKGMVVPGYYVEGPGIDGGLGPAAKIHPDGNSGFSFNRDLRFHICNIYAISDLLSNAIMLLHPNINIINEINPSTVDPSEWRKMLNRISTLPQFYYPDEHVKPQPEIRFSENTVDIIFPLNPRTAFCIPAGARITAILGGDGVTCTYKLPYWTPDS
jgi:hypothetical protein